jgi:hypothetical protein
MPVVPVGTKIDLNGRSSYGRRLWQKAMAEQLGWAFLEM